MELDKIKDRVLNCLGRLYEQDAELFTRNHGKGLCERCLVFRFAMYLQNEFPDFYVDCDFNSSCHFTANAAGGYTVQHDIPGKGIANPDGTITKRFVDIIIHRRSFNPGNDFICFEVKKWNNNSNSETQKDRNNLRILTSQYGYHYGFYLVLGRTLRETKWEIYQFGDRLNDLMYVE